MDIVFLDLPAVPIAIESELVECVTKMSGDPDSVRWLNDFHGNQVNSAEMIYGNQYTNVNRELLESIVQIFKPHLGSILPIVGRIRNITPQPALVPPHCDRARHVAINYILTAGGDAVETVFYQECRTLASLETSHNCRFEEVSDAKAHRLPLHQWHAFNAQRYHSVRNIIDTRIILSLVLADNPTWCEFTKKFSANCALTP